MNKNILIFLLLQIPLWVTAQGKVIDEVVAQIGDEIILRSDVEIQMLQMRDVKTEEREKARCFVIDQLMQRKLMLARAKADSLKVSDDQVENELNRRIQYMISNPQIGTAERLEEYFGKKILEIKNDFRKNIKEQILVEQMQNKIISGVDVTPSEIKTFFNNLPADSLPLYNTEVEISQVVIIPKPTKDAREEAKQKLLGIKKDVLAGANFGTKAVVYSQDNGSAIKRGDLGMMATSQFVPEFAAATLRLKKDSISDVVETKYGFHIIQMVERKGDMVHVKHILIKPEVSQEDIDNTKTKLDSIRTLINENKLTFQKAAEQFSNDDETKNRGGMLVDPKTNASRIALEEIDADINFAIDKLKPGEISSPLLYKTPDGRDAIRIVWLKSKTAQHKANLTDDYPRIKLMAMEHKKLDKMETWFKKYIQTTYIKINNTYSNCESLQKWKNVSK